VPKKIEFYRNILSFSAPALFSPNYSRFNLSNISFYILSFTGSLLRSSFPFPKLRFCHPSRTGFPRAFSHFLFDEKKKLRPPNPLPTRLLRRGTAFFCIKPVKLYLVSSITYLSFLLLGPVRLLRIQTPVSTILLQNLLIRGQCNVYLYHNQVALIIGYHKSQ